MQITKSMAAILVSLTVLLSGAAAGGTVLLSQAETDRAEASAVVLPEGGNWHAEVKLSDMEEIPFWARLLIAVGAGNTAFEVDVEIANDGTFTFESNTDKMKEEIAGSANTLIGLLYDKFDFSLYIDRAIEAILPETVMGEDRDCFGTFERDVDGALLVTTTEGETLRFRRFGKLLVQLDPEGAEVLKFQKAE